MAYCMMYKDDFVAVCNKAILDLESGLLYECENTFHEIGAAQKLSMIFEIKVLLKLSYLKCEIHNGQSLVYISRDDVKLLCNYL